jgi:hypothetical protein
MDLALSTILWIGCGLLVALAILCALAERRRARRRDLDRPGYVPWQLLEVFAFLLAVVAAALAVKAG